MGMSPAAQKKILVTGSTGSVGTAACADLVAAGHEVVGIDVRQPDGDVGYDFRACDLTREGALTAHLEGIDAVLHLAAIPNPRPASPPAIFDLNCAGTFRLFQACADAGIHHVVVASSINAIGYLFGTVPFEIDYLPVDEDHPKTTSDAYSFSKQVTEDIGVYFARREGIHNICLRFGAGLASLADLRGRHGDEFGAAPAALVEQLGAQSGGSRAEIARMQAVYDECRRGRMFEEGGINVEQPPAERQLMMLRHNYFSFVELGEACRAMRLSLTTPVEGSHTLFIVDRRNILGLPASLIADVVYPDVPRRGELIDDQSLVDWRRARDLLGFESEIPASHVLDS